MPSMKDEFSQGKDGHWRCTHGLLLSERCAKCDAKWRRGTAALDTCEHGSVAPPLKPSDPAVLAALSEVRTSLQLEQPITKLVTYVVAGNGLFSVRENKIALACARLSEAKVAGLPDVVAGVTLKVPKLPWALFTQIVAFFREVQAKHSAEAIVQVWLRTLEDGTPEYFIHVPRQSVSGAHVRHEGALDPDGAMLHVFDVHSHNTMDAFWSGTDDNDERKNARLYGVIGRVTAPVPAWRWRFQLGGTFHDLKLTDVVEVPETPYAFTVSFAHMLDEGTREGNGVGLVLPLDPFKDATFPVEWMTALDTGVVRVSYTLNTGGNGSEEKLTRKERKRHRHGHCADEPVTPPGTSGGPHSVFTLVGGMVYERLRDGSLRERPELTLNARTVDDDDYPLWHRH